MVNFFSANILSKYDVQYYKCTHCGLIQTENPFWLDEAYDSAIASLDVGLVQRNIRLSNKVSKLLGAYFDPCGKFLDFAGGYGLFVRLMRDKGFDFYRHDIHCMNIFAEYFDEPLLLNKGAHYELLTAFEVMEHVYDPISELKKLLSITDTVIFTTELLPAGVNCAEDWWYFVPETGQHITFYSEKSLKIISDQLSVNYSCYGNSLHIMTRKEISSDFLKPKKLTVMDRIRKVLSERLALPERNLSRNLSISIQNDFEYIKSKVVPK